MSNNTKRKIAEIEDYSIPASKKRVYYQNTSFRCRSDQQPCETTDNGDLEKESRLQRAQSDVQGGGLVKECCQSVRKIIFINMYLMTYANKVGSRSRWLDE